MKITVKRTINVNGQSITEEATTELPLSDDYELVAIRILVMRVAIKQSIEPMLPTRGWPAIVSALTKGHKK